MTVLIYLTTAGAGTGPFNLYSDLDGYVTPFETGVAKSALTTAPGYTSTVVPNGTSIIRVQSTGSCTNYIDLGINATTTTTTTSPATTTTTTTVASTSTLSFYYLGGDNATGDGIFTFNLTNPLSGNLVITGADVQLYDSTCTSMLDSALQAATATITAGSTVTSVPSNSAVCTDRYVRSNTLVVNGNPVSNGSTIVIGSTTVTVSIITSCVILGCVA